MKISNTNFQILQSGYLPDQFNVQRGCRQGYPVATYLFILCTEIFSILNKQNKEIKSIIINNKKYKLTQYTDDTSLTIGGSEQFLFAALDT